MYVKDYKYNKCCENCSFVEIPLNEPPCKTCNRLTHKYWQPLSALKKAIIEARIERNMRKWMK